MLPKINSAHGSETRNIINRAIEVLNAQGKTIQDLVAEGQLTEGQYAELITVINGLIKSGHVDKSDLTSEFKDEIEGFSAQLARKASIDQARLKTQKIELEDMSASTLGAMSGNASFDLLSVPQDNSVTNKKMNIPYNRLAKTFKFERGSLSAADGSHQSANSRVRSESIIFLKKGAIIKQENPITQFFVYEYDQQGDYLGSLISWTKEYLLTKDAYVRLVQSYEDNRRILLSELDEIDNNLYVVDDDVFATREEVKKLNEEIEPIPPQFDGVLNEVNRLEGVINGLEGYNPPQTLKVLSIGNSFSEDGLTHLHDIAKSAGVEVITAFLNLGGQKLEDHLTNIRNGTLYGYAKWTADLGRHTPGSRTIDDGVLDEDWDVITFQQASDLSGRYETFQPYLTDLITHVKGVSTNPFVKVGLHMTWAYSTDSNHSGFPHYDNNQMTMYHAIVDAHLRAFEESDVDLLIPSGTAIQNARTNAYLNDAGRELTRDGYHLDEGVGRYAAALTWFETLIAGKYKKDIFADVTFRPNFDNATKFLTYLAKIAAKNANMSPFKITDI